MGKFSIECPSCGNYVGAKTGLFAKRRIECSCGKMINVQVERLQARPCPHCGNIVVCDVSKGEFVKCPVCGEKVETEQGNTFSCVQCGVRLHSSRSASKYVCPVCDTENDVQERFMAEDIKKDGLASIIKYEGDNTTFIWKHPIEDFNYGSQLIVHESQEAIFFKDGQALDLFGPGRYTLETQQLPLLEKAYKLPTDTEGTFHSEVYFINKTVQMGIKWGTPEKVRFIDPLTGVPLELGASGEMNLQIDNSRKLLLKLVGTMGGIAWADKDGFTKSIQSSFRPLISNAVKANLSSVIINQAIDILEIDTKLDIISEKLRECISAGFEEYGLTIPQLYVMSIVLPEEDPNFKRIKELHTITLQTRVIQAEATVKTAQAQSEAQYRTAQEQSKAAIEAAHREAVLQEQTTATEVAKMEAERRVITAQAEAQAQRMAGLTEAEIMQAKGYTQKDVIQAEVQKAYAEGIGNMGPAITAGGGGGSSIVGDMMGLGVGMAAASAIAPQIGGMLQGIGQPIQQMQPQSMVQNSFGAPWNCICGQTNIVGNFCNNCGARKPQPVMDTWNCICGNSNIIGNFCNICGKKRGE